MTHPALDNRMLPHSCHFDIFPTIFDLLGVTPNYPYFGQTMGLEDKEKAYFFHSATLKGNTPANFCSLIDDHMYWNDRLFSQAYELKWDNGNWLRNSQCNGTDISALNTALLTSFSLKL
jgi:phosphoglycerol transferase MdoB-like AlkP superfamily enzyme